MIVKPDCCEQGHETVRYREKDPFRGPHEAGWSIIKHILVGPPEYIKIIFCPFCGKQLKINMDENEGTF